MGAQLAQALAKFPLAVVNTNFALPAGLLLKDALFHESDADAAAYANVIVVRTEDQKDPRIQHLVAALQSEEVRAAAKKLFGDEAIPAF